MTGIFYRKKLEKGEKCKYKNFVKHVEHVKEFFHFLSSNIKGTAKKDADIHPKGQFNLGLSENMRYCHHRCQWQFEKIRKFLMKLHRRAI
jgi:hypothetical protein